MESLDKGRRVSFAEYSMSAQYQREAKELSQGEAARRAGVSLATWRRWESDPSSVRRDTAAKCERVLAGPTKSNSELESMVRKANEIWGESKIITPRQAWALMSTLDLWGDLYIGEWLQATDEPLHEVEPFTFIDKRVMMLVAENRAWAAMVKQRCHMLSTEIQEGILPFFREGPYIDEVLIGAALLESQQTMDDVTEDLDGLVVRKRDTEVGPTPSDDFSLSDDDWDVVGDNFDDVAQWDDWEVPLFTDHPVLPALLEQRHPFRWFDTFGPRPTMSETLAEHLGIEESELMERRAKRIGSALSGLGESNTAASPTKKRHQ